MIDVLKSEPYLIGYLCAAVALAVLSFVHRAFFRGCERHGWDELPSDPPTLKKTVRTFWIARGAFALVVLGSALASASGIMPKNAVFVAISVAFMGHTAITLWLNLTHGVFAAHSLFRHSYVIATLTGRKRGLYVLEQLVETAVWIVFANYVVSSSRWIDLL